MLVLFLGLCPSPQAANPVIATAHKTTHRIQMHNLVFGGGGSCSATAIGPHALLTASHCQAISDTIMVDDKKQDIVEVFADGLDHSIYLLDGDAFPAFASVNARKMEQGDEVFVIGNPGPFTDLYRKGTVTGFQKNADDDDDDLTDMLKEFITTGKKVESKKPKKHTPRVTFYDFNGFFGDSGSAIFDNDGKITAVTSFIDGATYQGYAVKMMGGFELRFSAARLKEAREFGTK